MDPTKRRNRTVLVVDDDRALRMVLVLAIGDAGHEVLEASNGFTALRLAERERPDLVLLDLALPDVSGPDVLHELKAHPSTSGIPVIVVTARPGLLQDSPSASGAELVIQKPFDLEELLWHVERALAQPRSRRATPVAPATDPHRGQEPLAPPRLRTPRPATAAPAKDSPES